MTLPLGHGGTLMAGLRWEFSAPIEGGRRRENFGQYSGSEELNPRVQDRLRKTKHRSVKGTCGR